MNAEPRADLLPDGMRMLVVRQPWALMIALGFKTTENRSWTTRHRGPLAIAAGLAWDTAGEHDPRVRAAWRRFAADLARKQQGNADPGPYGVAGQLTQSNLWFDRGAIVSVVDLDDCHRWDCTDHGQGCGDGVACCSPWGDAHANHWTVSNARRLPEPVPVTGRQGLTLLTPTARAQVDEQLARTAEALPAGGK
ncbi:MAG: hypothetical protein EPO06_11920 [Burkholderiaceae bacterium]|nr:MAG: hypothetical protein EPO06_11920 [Burkholderiaceae bacterium]